METIEIIEANLKQIRSNFDLIRRGFDYNSLKNKLEDLKLKSSDPKVWESNNAKAIFKEIKNLENKIYDFNRLHKQLNDNEEIYNFIQKNKDYSLLNELKTEVKLTLNSLKKFAM